MRKKQTEQLMPAMDNRYFNILGTPPGDCSCAELATRLDLSMVAMMPPGGHA
jgi:hypothetical protein